MLKFLSFSVVALSSVALPVNAQLLPNPVVVPPITVDPAINPPITTPTVPINPSLPPLGGTPITIPTLPVNPNLPPLGSIPTTPISTPPINTPIGSIPPIVVGGDNLIDIPSTGVVIPGTGIDLGAAGNGIVGGAVTLPGGDIIQPILNSAGQPVAAIDSDSGQILPVSSDGVVSNPQGQPIGDINNAGGAGGTGNGGSGGQGTSAGGSAATNLRVDNRNYNFSIPQAPLGYEEVTTTDKETGVTTVRKGSVTTLTLTGGSIAGEGVFLGQIAIPLR